MKLAVHHVSAPMASPFAAAHGTVTTRDLLVVSLETKAGLTGHGEAAPLPSYDGVGVADVCDALRRCRPIIERASEDDDPRQVMKGCMDVTALPQALAAVDLALWDLAGRRSGQPMWRLLGASDPVPVAVNWTIAAEDRSGAGHEATLAREGGLGTVKVKVGIGDDAGRLAAVRACAGRDMLIRIDANGAWSPAEAEASLRHLAPVGIELCEEPVSGAQAIRALGEHTEVALALDESADDPTWLDTRMCEFACLKISRCGGITGTVSAAARARAAGYRVYLASTLDGPLGIAAALHAAAVIAPDVACGLATLRLFEGRTDPLPALEGAISAPAGPGLGDGLLGWYGAVG